jgi:Trk K+ transport system NAD-binding subunit
MPKEKKETKEKRILVRITNQSYQRIKSLLYFPKIPFSPILRTFIDLIVEISILLEKKKKRKVDFKDVIDYLLEKKEKIEKDVKRQDKKK